MVFCRLLALSAQRLHVLLFDLDSHEMRLRVRQQRVVFVGDKPLEQLISEQRSLVLSAQSDFAVRKNEVPSLVFLA